MKSNQVLRVVVVCLAAATLTGCGLLVAAGIGGGAAYTYKQGWLSNSYNADLNRTYNASLQAVRENNMELVDQTKNIASGEIRAKKGDETYWIKMSQKSPQLTEVSVRAGLIGDKAASRKIQGDIKQALTG